MTPPRQGRTRLALIPLVAMLLGAAALAQPASAAPVRSQFVGTYQVAEWQTGTTYAAIAAEQSRSGQLLLFLDLETGLGTPGFVETFTEATSYTAKVGPHLSSVTLSGIASGTSCSASACGVPATLNFTITLTGTGATTRSTVLVHDDGGVSHSTTMTRSALASGTVGGVELAPTDAVIADGSFVSVARIP